MLWCGNAQWQRSVEASAHSAHHSCACLGVRGVWSEEQKTNGRKKGASCLNRDTLGRDSRPPPDRFAVTIRARLRFALACASLCAHSGAGEAEIWQGLPAPPQHACWKVCFADCAASLSFLFFRQEDKDCTAVVAPRLFVNYCREQQSGRLWNRCEYIGCPLRRNVFVGDRDSRFSTKNKKCGLKKCQPRRGVDSIGTTCQLNPTAECPLTPRGQVQPPTTRTGR